MSTFVSPVRALASRAQETPSRNIDLAQVCHTDERLGSDSEVTVLEQLSTGIYDPHGPSQPRTHRKTLSWAGGWRKPSTGNASSMTYREGGKVMHEGSLETRPNCTFTEAKISDVQVAIFPEGVHHHQRVERTTYFNVHHNNDQRLTSNVQRSNVQRPNVPTSQPPNVQCPNVQHATSNLRRPTSQRPHMCNVSNVQASNLSNVSDLSNVSNVSSVSSERVQLVQRVQRVQRSTSNVQLPTSFA